MDLDGVTAVLIEHGMLLQSAKGPIPNVADLVAGEPISGSWWGHAHGHAIYDILASLDDSPDVARMRLVKGKVTLVHRRVWPALVRLADRFTPAQLSALHEEHTPSGAHRVGRVPFPEWVPADDVSAAGGLSEAAALELMPACLTR